MSVSMYLALVHHPIVNKRGEVVTTSVTNLDLHDIARSCRTFGFKKYFVITPIIPQQELVKKILLHWKSDVANEYNPDRQDALAPIAVYSSWQEAASAIENLENVAPIVVTTAAQMLNQSGTTTDLKIKARTEKRPILLILGTGWGLHRDVIDASEFRLNPIPSASTDGYNHLSVRSAAAIYTARLGLEELP